jgi:hypothetical protein
VPVTAQTSKALSIGAGDVYVNGSTVGATEDNSIFRITRTYFSPNINGTAWKLKGTDYVDNETAELEVTVPELSMAVMSYSTPGGITTAGDAPGIAYNLTTTLAASSAIGDVNVKVASVTTVTTGDVIVIGAAGSREYRSVTAVGTIGSGGTGVTFLGGLTMVHTSGDACVTTASTTLAADSAIGATNLKVASVAGLAVGTWVRIGYLGDQEMRVLNAVGTIGSSGTGVSFAVPTVQPHRSGDYLAQQGNEGSSVYTSGAYGAGRRIPSSAYNNWYLEVPGLDGRKFRFNVYNALSSDVAEYAAADAANMKPRLKLQARSDPATPSVSPWDITYVAPIL